MVGFNSDTTAVVLSGLASQLTSILKRMDLIEVSSLSLFNGECHTSSGIFQLHSRNSTQHKHNTKFTIALQKIRPFLL